MRLNLRTLAVTVVSRFRLQFIHAESRLTNLSSCPVIQESFPQPDPHNTAQPPYKSRNGRTKRPTYAGLTPASGRASAAAKATSRKTGTAPEITLQRALQHQNITYSTNDLDLPGAPDIVFAEGKVVVFCDGDFWHGNKWGERRGRIRTGHNANYWISKIERNMQRDTEINARLASEGWLVLRFWESEIKANLARVLATITLALHIRGTET